MLEPLGRIDGPSSPDFEKALLEHLEKQDCVVNFSHVPYISSAGLRVVMMAAKKSQSAGFGLHLCGMDEVVKEIFEVSGFNNILNVHDDLNAVMAWRQ